MKSKHLFEKMKHATEEQTEESFELMDELMEDVKERFPSYYRKYQNRLEEIFGRNHESVLTENEAKEYVAHMENKDGTHGAHWTLMQVRRLADGRPELKRYDCLAFYVTLNMMYSDYYRPGKTEDYYICLAEDFLDDKDAPEDKLRRYMEAMEK